MSNHGKIGKVLHIKFASDKIPFKSKDKIFKHGDILDVDFLNKHTNLSSAVPIHIDDNTQGDYEAACENGTEVWYWDEVKRELESV